MARVSQTEVLSLLSRPPDLTDDEVAAAAGVPAVEYLPAGFGSHHWVTGDLFVTVDDLDGKDWLGSTRDEVYDGLDRALTVVRGLDLDFAVAPLGPLRRLTDRYAIAVYPRLDVLGHGGDATPLLAALRAVPAPSGAPVLDLHASSRTVRSLLDHPLLAGSAVALERTMESFEGLLRDAPLVLTHGEPHTRNLVRTPDGLRLVDWDTVALAPAERDLWLLDPPAGDPALCAAFKLRWDLTDIAIFVMDIDRDAPDADASLRYLWETLDGLDRTYGGHAGAQHRLDAGP